jgi:hypothetical protein
MPEPEVTKSAKPEVTGDTAGRPISEFPSGQFPVVFADGVLSHVSAAGQTKFYLFRIDPNMYGRGGAIFNPIAQVVMPTLGFLSTAAFLYKRALAMVKSGEVTQEQFDQAMAAQP